MKVMIIYGFILYTSKITQVCRYFNNLKSPLSSSWWKMFIIYARCMICLSCLLFNEFFWLNFHMHAKFLRGKNRGEKQLSALVVILDMWIVVSLDIWIFWPNHREKQFSALVVSHDIWIFLAWLPYTCQISKREESLGKTAFCSFSIALLPWRLITRVASHNFTSRDLRMCRTNCELGENLSRKKNHLLAIYR